MSVGVGGVGPVGEEFGKYKYTGYKVETETNLKDMSHPIRRLKVNGNDMLRCQSAAYQCVCVSVCLGEKQSHR